MKIELTRLTDEQLSKLKKRYLKSSPTKKELSMLRQIARELLRRKKLVAMANLELKCIPGQHPHFLLITDEIKNRCRLNLLERETEQYSEIYHVWFAQRLQGLELKLYRWLIPLPEDELWMLQ